VRECLYSLGFIGLMAVQFRTEAFMTLLRHVVCAPCPSEPSAGLRKVDLRWAKGCIGTKTAVLGDQR
jgi:hypothetical protein